MTIATVTTWLFTLWSLTFSSSGVPQWLSPTAIRNEMESQRRSPLLVQANNTCEGVAILDAETCAGDGWEPEEEALYQQINDYRVAYGLPVVPRSPALTKLANRHVLDLSKNIGHLTHSWSDCSYDPNNPRTYACSARAPKRLGIRYSGRVYENAHYNAFGATAASAFRGWSHSPAHNALILNQSNWHDNEWRAMGIGIYGQYAVMWVGQKRDRSQ